jgi:PAS domain S-box-containing protein
MKESGKDSGGTYFSPIQLLIVIAISIFIIEFIMMLILIFLPHESILVHALLSSSLLVLFLSPILYFFIFRPLLTHITEREKFEEALIKSETRYRLVHNTAFDAIITSNAGDKIIDCNPSAADIFGYDQEAMIGMNLVDIMPEKYRKPHLNGLSHFLETGESKVQGKVLELEGLRKNGEVFPIELIVSSFMVDSVTSFTGTIRDITQRKRAKKEKELIERQLNQSQKLEAVGRLGGGIAHDFNNILTSIRGNAELALDDMKTDDPLSPRFEEIITSVEHASKLTRQLLLFSRNQPFEPMPLDINTIIENLMKMLNRLISTDIEITTDLEEGIWAIEADSVNIEQVVINLAVNARDAMEDGGRLDIKTGNVIIDEQEAAKTPNASPCRAVCLTIKDNGAGMKPNTVNRIFEPFFTTKGAGKGSGLGLAVVYGIVKQHGGWITVKSSPDKGTCFRVFIPASPGKVLEETEAADSAVKAAKGPRGSSERILFIEDEQSVREVTRKILVENGYVVFAAEDADIAMGIFEEEGGLFDIILSDVVLTGMSGIELARRLIKKKPGLRVLLTSGYMDDESYWETINELGFKFLQKPYSLNLLLETIHSLKASG